MSTQSPTSVRMSQRLTDPAAPVLSFDFSGPVPTLPRRSAPPSTWVRRTWDKVVRWMDEQL